MDKYQNVKDSFRRAVCVLGLTIAASASAQTFPTRPITILYPYGAGSDADGIVRAMAPEMGKMLGQAVVVEGRPGAGGRLALQAQRLPTNRGDGHLLSMITNGNVVTLPLGDSSFKIEPGKDYTPVAAMFLGPFVLAVHSSLGIRDVKSLVAYARANPTKFNVGHTGIGGAQHLSLALFSDLIGLPITMIAYKGQGTLFPAFLANEVQAAFASGIKTHVDAGRIVPLAITSPRRSAQFPDVPTVEEAGFPKLTNLGFWTAIAGPPDVPRGAVNQLNTTINAVFKQPLFVKRVNDLGYEMLGGTPEDLTSIIRSDLEKMGPVMQKLGIKLE